MGLSRSLKIRFLTATLHPRPELTLVVIKGEQMMALVHALPEGGGWMEGHLITNAGQGTHIVLNIGLNI